MNTFEAIKLLMEQDIRGDYDGDIFGHESVAEHLAERIDTLWNENEKLKARNEQLEAALRPFAKGPDWGHPPTIGMFCAARKALEGKDN